MLITSLYTTGNSNLPHVPGVGLCKQHELSDGRIITTIYPSVKYRKVPYAMENVILEDLQKPHNYPLAEEDAIDCINPFEKARQIHQKGNKFYHTFVKGIPKITKECLKASEYEFENGLRKVRLVQVQGFSRPLRGFF